MPPRLRRLLSPECIRDAGKLIYRHVGQAIVIHDSTGPRLLAMDDVTARGLGLVITVDTVAQVDGRVRAE